MKVTSRARVSPPVASVVVVGLGNIGSQLIDHLGRMPGLRRVTLIDRDVYEPFNLGSQRISPRDIGRAKAVAQARHLRRLNPALDVTVLVDDVANVPLGLLRAGVILSCLDSLEARLEVNECALRLGVPLLDAGIEPEQQLVRVTGYLPGPTQPCLACALEAGDYEQLGARHLCLPSGGSAPPPTNGPPALGAFAAALLAVECTKILSGNFSHALLSRQLVIDVAHHRHFVSSLRRNLECRFDHSVWPLAPLRGIKSTDTLGSLLRKARRAARANGDSTFRLADRPLAQALACPGCGHVVHRVHVSGRVTQRCPRCHSRALVAPGSSLLDCLTAATPRPVLQHSLRAVGLRAGDVVEVSTGRRQTHLEIH